VVCDALLLDPQSRTDTYPTIEIEVMDIVSIGHGPSVSKVGEAQLFILMSRGLSQEDQRTPAHTDGPFRFQAMPL